MKVLHCTLVALVVLTMATAGFAQHAKVIGSVHDVGSAGCGSCHAPHNGGAASGKILLWNRNFSSVAFGTYDSPTVQSKATEVGGLPLANTEPRMSSQLCMSCHDGVTSTSVLPATAGSAIGNPTNSQGLTNDHPVNMSMDPALDAQLNPVASVTSAGLVLFGANNTVQCGTCHNVHDNTTPPFLRKANTNSALCTTCHK